MKKSTLIPLILLIIVLWATAITFSILSVVTAFKPLEYVEAISPTCTEQGSIAHYIDPKNGLQYADFNGQTILTIDKISVPALGHDFAKDFTVDKSSTCAELGSKSKHCTRCEAKCDITEIPKSENHIYSSRVIKPTSTTQGYTLYSCINCNNSYVENYVDAYLDFSLSEQDNYSYSVSGCNITEKMSVTIPETYNGRPVTAIGNAAFENNSYILGVTLPKSIVSIGDSAFSGCSKLTNINYLGTVESWYKIEGISSLMQNGASNKTLVIGGKPHRMCEICGSLGDTQNFNGGCGEENHPYLISTKTHFENIGKVNTQDKYLNLINDIDLGVWNSPFDFLGSLDGNNYKITYTQSLNGNANFYGGLFTRLNNGSKVQNLRINASVTIKYDGTKNGFVGGLAGITSGEVNISRVSIDGNISIGNYSGVNFVGGLLGKYVGGTVSECANFAEIKNWGRNVFSGGIIGYAIASDNSIKISNCYNWGNVLSSSNYTAAYGWRSGGGIAGQVRGDNKNKLNFEYCYNDSVVKLEWTGGATGGFQGCGGILGDIRDNNSNNITVDLCYWNSAKMSTYGNNNNFHNNNGRKNMTGVYDRWSTEIWIFSNAAAPTLKWMQI